MTPADLAPLHVLVVDDEAPLRLLVGSVLRRRDDFADVVASDGGVDDLRGFAGQPVDVVLLDLNLAGGRRGTDLLPLIREQWPDAMVAVFSALSASLEAPAALRAGAHAYYEKTQIGDLPDLVRRDWTDFAAARP